MKETEHTPEPWKAKDGGLIGPTDRPSIAQVLSKGTEQGDELARANARRIVACVNACKGIPTDFLENENLENWHEFQGTT